MVNSCHFVGRLGRDSETRFMPDGKAVTNFSIGVSESWKGKDGTKQESTEWVRVSTFGKLAEICGEYLKKGSLVYIQGKMQTRKWQNKEGVDQYTTEIIANEMKMLGGKPEGAKDSAPAPKSKQAPAPKGDFDDFDSVPF